MIERKIVYLNVRYSFIQPEDEAYLRIEHRWVVGKVEQGHYLTPAPEEPPVPSVRYVNFV